LQEFARARRISADDTRLLAKRLRDTRKPARSPTSRSPDRATDPEVGP
jgi:hypothetical protein